MDDTKETKCIQTIQESAVSMSFKGLSECQKQGLFCDLTLRSKDGLEYKVHKIVMNSRIGFFKDLFASDFKDSAADNVQLEVSTGAVLEEVILFVYQGELKAKSAEDLVEIAKVAKYLQIEELTQVCVLRLQNLINDRTCLICWKQASEYSLEKLEEMCISYTLSSAQRLFQDPSFLVELTATELKILLKDTRLKCESKVVFKAVEKWATDKTSSTDEFLELYSEVAENMRFSCLGKEFILANVLQNEALLKIERVRAKLYDSIKHEGEDLLQNPRSLAMWKRQFLAVRGAEILGILTDEGKMKKLHNNDHLFKDFGYTVFGNNFLLACGGVNDSDEMQNTCKYFSPVTREWTTIQSMQTGRSGHRCAYLGGKIYACGGELKGGGSTGSVEIFDQNTENWLTGPTIQYKRECFGLTSKSGSLYLIGAKSDESYVTMLDPRTSNAWSLPAPNIPYSTKHCVSIGDYIYCFDTSQYIFDTRMNKSRDWKVIALSEGYWQDVYSVTEIDGEIGIFFPKKLFLHSYSG